MIRRGAEKGRDFPPELEEALAKQAAEDWTEWRPGEEPAPPGAGGRAEVACVIDMQGGKIGARFSREDVSPTLTRGRGSSDDVHAVCFRDVWRGGWSVRRLMPVECERLFGLPDGHTVPEGLAVDDALADEFLEVFRTWDVISCGTPKERDRARVRRWLEKVSDPATCPDAPRYMACGNSFGVNVVRWIGLGIQADEDGFGGVE